MREVRDVKDNKVIIKLVHFFFIVKAIRIVDLYEVSPPLCMRLYNYCQDNVIEKNNDVGKMKYAYIYIDVHIMAFFMTHSNKTFSSIDSVFRKQFS